MPVQRHFVGSGRFGDGFDPNRPDPMAVKEIHRDREDALARRNSLAFSAGYHFCRSFHEISPLTSMLPVSTYVGVTGQYHKGRPKSIPLTAARVDTRRKDQAP